MNPEPALAEAIGSLVDNYRVRRVPLRDVLAAAAAVDRSAAASVEWRARVLAAITALADLGRVEVPRTRADRTAEPALPSYVVRPAVPRAAPAEVLQVVWHFDLAWVALEENTGRLSVAERRFLTKVNTWLPRRRGVVVPLRERSLEIFGDEKELEAWAFGPLFAPDRLTLELLECESCWPPVEQRVFGSGDWLIIENYTTYVSISRAARRHGFDGRIVWGSGSQVGTRLMALAATGDRPRRCWYFGDIDTGGFQAARLADTRATDLGFGAIAPARGLYRLAITLGHDRRTTGGRTPSKELTQWICSWLGESLAETVIALVSHGQRIVQENVGTEVLETGENLAEWLD